ncbi:MAG: FAD-dependent monooxygenase [Pseudoclavibacter sp.]
MYDVIISGGGPTGTMLASELRLHGVQVLVIERDPEPTRLVRSLGLHARSAEILDQRGLLERFLEAGTVHPVAGGFAGLGHAAPESLDTDHAFILGLPQPVTDRLLTERAVELGAELRRGVEVVGFEHDDLGVAVELRDGSTERASWLVGCDGGHSLIRRMLGVEFPGEDATTEWMLGEFESTMSSDEVAGISAGVRETHRGFGVGQTPDGHFRGVVPAASVSADRGSAPSFDDFRARLREVAGTDFGANAPRALTRFTDATRLASRYRVGRVLIAGDAAHVHPPLGGQGLNLGIQDAFNLGWKLAAEVAGWAPDDLLDTYGAERRPVADDVLTFTRAQSVLISPAPGAQALRRVMAELAEFDVVSRYLASRVASIDIRYDVGGGAADGEAPEPVGRRMRDVRFAGGARQRGGGQGFAWQGDRLYALMRAGRGLVLDPHGAVSVDGWGDRVDHVVDGPDFDDGSGGSGLSNVFPDADIPEGAAVLLRPDGHIVWIGDDATTLSAALRRWFGAEHPAPRPPALRQTL